MSPTANAPLRVMVGLSGGVDSSVAALLLQQQGYQVSALFMKNWEEDDADDYCSAAADLADAQAVADQLGITLHRVNFAAEYWDRVFALFLQEYRAGRTPNPDILCNSEIKFRAFLDHARHLGADCIATGHYATTHYEAGQWQLGRGADGSKDQSYFLHRLNQQQLAAARFPLGHLAKSAVRAIAQQQQLPTHAKRDSTGICFIGERRFRDFLSRYLPASPGEIYDLDQRLLGQHQGLMYYTIGQRQGLGIGGRRDSGAAPWYVVGKDLSQNRLLVAQGHNHPHLFSHTLEASQLHWISGPPPTTPLICRAQIRYRQQDQACRLEPLPNRRCRVLFDEPQRAVTPGQAVVFYQQQRCLGGATIESTH